MVANLWTVKELAKAANLSHEQVRLLLRGGEIQGSKIGRSWVVDSVEAKRWLTRRKAELEAQAKEIEV